MHETEWRWVAKIASHADDLRGGTRNEAWEAMAKQTCR